MRSLLQREDVTHMYVNIHIPYTYIYREIGETHGVLARKLPRRAAARDHCQRPLAALGLDPKMQGVLPKESQ